MEDKIIIDTLKKGELKITRVATYSYSLETWNIIQQVEDDLGLVDLDVLEENISEKKIEESRESWTFANKPFAVEEKKEEESKAPFVNDLTSDQWRLHDYLNAIYPSGATKEQIVEALSTIYPRYLESCKEENSGVYRKLRADFQALQSSLRLQSVYGNIGGFYKKLTREEYKEMSYRKWQEIAGMIKRQQNQDKRMGLDGQMRLVFGKEKEIIECFKEV